MDTQAIQDPSRFAHQNHFMVYNHIVPGAAGDDWAEMYLDVEKNTTNAYGQVHGGALFGMADCCAGRVARLNGQFYVTQDASVQFIHNVDSGRLTARGTIVNRGRRVCLVRVEIHAENGRLLFHGIFSMFRIQP